jgi:hypothetical protein
LGSPQERLTRTQSSEKFSISPGGIPPDIYAFHRCGIHAFATALLAGCGVAHNEVAPLP